MIDMQIISTVSKKPLMFPKKLYEIAEAIHDRALELIEDELSKYNSDSRKIAVELFERAYDEITKKLSPLKRVDVGIFYKAWQKASNMYDQIAKILGPVISDEWMEEFYADGTDIEPEEIELDWQLVYKDALEQIETKFGNDIAETIDKNIHSIVMDLGGGYNKLNTDYMNDIGTDFIEENIKNAVSDEIYLFIGNYNDKNIKFKLLLELLKGV